MSQSCLLYYIRQLALRSFVISQWKNRFQSEIRIMTIFFHYYHSQLRLIHTISMCWRYFFLFDFTVCQITCLKKHIILRFDCIGFCSSQISSPIFFNFFPLSRCLSLSSLLVSPIFNINQMIRTRWYEHISSHKFSSFIAVWIVLTFLNMCTESDSRGTLLSIINDWI